MMYVKDRSADSICDTALEFLVIKSEYMPSHFGGNERTSVVRCVACLYIVAVAVRGLTYRCVDVVLREAGAIRGKGEVILAWLPRSNR